MKKTLSLFLALVFVFCAAAPVSAKVEKDPIYDIALDSQAAFMQNLETGSVLIEKNADLRMYPGSVTKVMTALLVLENCPDTAAETITVPDAAMFTYILEEGGVNMALQTGETITVGDLLRGMMMNSFCDAAELLAYHFGSGRVSAFIDKMNARAEELGCKNSHFVNAHGLHENNHYSSAHDLGIILAQAVKDARFVEIIRTRTGVIPATNRSPARKLTYTVGMFYPENSLYLDAFVGGKSGFTNQAGRCLATYSDKDGVSYVTVLLGANLDTNKTYPGNMTWIETNALVSYAYENFTVKKAVEKGETLSEIAVIDADLSIPLAAGEDAFVLARKDAEIKIETDHPDAIEADKVKNGAVCGRILIVIGDETSDVTYPLVFVHDDAPIKTKGPLRKEAEEFVSSAGRLFREDKVFITLCVLLLCVIAAAIPAIRITKSLHDKKTHPPKH